MSVQELLWSATLVGERAMFSAFLLVPGALLWNADDALPMSFLCGRLSEWALSR